MKNEETWKQKIHKQRQAEAKYNAKKKRERDQYLKINS